MTRIMARRARRTLLLGAAALMAGLQGVSAASLKWERRGTFETCLENRLNDWVKAKAELVINEDPSAGDLDDIDVAMWAVAVLQDCESQAGHGSQASEYKFSQHMAHWREHIHNVAQTVRQRVRAD
jgi:hypothetical protein